MKTFDVIVVGGGHAGIEAAHAAASLGMDTALITLDKKMIGNMPCNPHIGGSAKGIVVREIDALGGLMAIAADQHPLQVKMLNTRKGPGVQCLRSQQDKYIYPEIIQDLLGKLENLTIIEDEVVDLTADGDAIKGVVLASGETLPAKAVILTTGTYLNGRIISGRDIHDGGPDGAKASLHLTAALERLGIEMFRLKTGTPPRIKKSTIDFSKGSIQPGTEDRYAFSYSTTVFKPIEEQLPCYLIYTTEKTLQIIKDHLEDSALFDGTIVSAGPRYCPSIESKVVRFSDKPRHQLFLEPEVEDGESIYLQGFSTAMPKEVQEEMVHSLPGLEHAEILKYAYQIEYDALKPFQFDNTLRVKKFQNLYVAGQICGTSGYEEAGGLGLMAGINASMKLLGKPEVVLGRNEAYIGVMIDDLVTKGTEEPYRLLSSRAEYRLLLRHDNADARLCEKGYKIGLLCEKAYERYLHKYQRINEAIEIMKTYNVADKAGLNAYLEELGFPPTEVGQKGYDLLKRPNVSYVRIAALMDELKDYRDLDADAILSLETKVKYEGYIRNQMKEAENLIKEESMLIPEDTDYLHMDGLRLEARDKLNRVRPKTIAQAARISGVNPADVSILLLQLRKRKK